MGKTQANKKQEKKAKLKPIAQSASSSVPSASALADAVLPKGSAAKVGGDGNVHLYLMPFCSDGSVYGTEFDGPMDAVHAISIGKPNVFY